MTGTSDLVDLSDRYHLVGVTTEERENNAGIAGNVVGGQEGRDQHVEGKVVYTTNDREEANAIAKRGGFQRKGQPWIAVQGWHDSQKPANQGDDKKPVSMGDV